MDDASQVGAIIISLSMERIVADLVAALSFLVLALSLVHASVKATGNVSRQLRPYLRALSILCGVLALQNAVFLFSVFSPEAIKAGMTIKLCSAGIVAVCAAMFLATRHSLARIVGAA